MAKAPQINRKVYKTRKGATRQVPAAVTEWAESLSDRLWGAFESEKTDWQHDTLVPTGDPNYAADGMVRKTDAELERFELVVSASVYATYLTGTIEDIAFGLRGLIDELIGVHDALLESDDDGDDDSDLPSDSPSFPSLQSR